MTARIGWAGHFWTAAPALANALRGHGDGARRWSTTVDDPNVGPVRLSGLLEEVPGADGIVVIVHGLGGRPTSHYCRRAALAARRAGLSSLRLALRGADRSGEDVGHAGLTADVRAALASPEVARHARVVVIGYSIGGHVALRLAAEGGTPAPARVAAVCPPIDLARAARAFDEEIAAPYRRWVLTGLKSIHARMAARRRVATPAHLVRRARTVREWDAMVVVPRHGFADVDDYYRRASVAPLLSRLAVPSLLIAAENDPVVPAGAVRPALPAPTPDLEVRWTDAGGHVGFPAGVDLGLPGERGLESQVLAWLTRA